MTKRSRKYVQPGCLTQKKTAYEKIRDKNMEQNATIFESLGLKSLANGLFGSNSSTKKKSSKLAKSKTGSGNDDWDYEQDEGEEGMSSSDEGGVSSRLQGNKVCRAPRKKGCYTAHISKDSEPCWTNTSIPIGETQVVQRQALTPLVDPVQCMPEVTTQPIQLPTSSTQPHHLPNAGITITGQTFDIGGYKNDMEARETIDLKCQDLYKMWKSNLSTCYFAMKNKVGDPKNHAPYPCKPEDWVFMIDNVWETKDWKTKSDRGKHARSKVKFNHTSGSRSFISRASMIAKLKAKLKEQSQPNVTNPSSQRQISVDVLGKRSVYVKEYGSRMSTISSFNQPQELDPESTVLQKKVDDQAKTLTKYSRTVTVVQGLVQVLAIKAGVDPAQVQEVIDRCNSEAGTSDEEANAAGNSDELNTLDEEDDEASISSEEDDATSTG
ncbi:hypothetical protein RHMOL_Rhmol11G0214800 [Rhododendron molle]|uniref:Uncharacterized protein n=3 Tax=Rhododendron molle TaxID=49168 RepID=A0ACC0LVP6_RHOML|nr:hypothetical protein RHMOL_Rhmol11G0214800 [Rhododendron molle]KAI8532444.1 hypothetical protein RHMOL_Rhmol11G0214800 [Rhododendron molle]KAI8532445.1 hypothetical protein RHMOL_Rhmol11G0214800 [Rhododendron molle]